MVMILYRRLCRRYIISATIGTPPRTTEQHLVTRYECDWLELAEIDSLTRLYFARADVNVSYSLSLDLPPRRAPLMSDPPPNLGLQPYGRGMLKFLQ